MNSKISYLILRLAIGLSMFGHGLVRIPKLKLFSEGMLKEFENSLLPEFVVQPFSYLLPFAEFTVGIFLLLGLYTRTFAIAGAAIMLMLIFGTTLVENWGGLVPQLIHSAFFAFLIQNISNNYFALDSKLKKNKL